MRLTQYIGFGVGSCQVLGFVDDCFAIRLDEYRSRELVLYPLIHLLRHYMSVKYGRVWNSDTGNTSQNTHIPFVSNVLGLQLASSIELFEFFDLAMELVGQTGQILDGSGKGLPYLSLATVVIPRPKHSEAGARSTLEGGSSTKRLRTPTTLRVQLQISINHIHMCFVPL